MRRVEAVLPRVFRIRSMMALALMVWCAGAGCMLVSYARAEMTDAAASSYPADQMMAGASSSMGAHGCCKAKHRSGSISQTQSASTASLIDPEQSLLIAPSTPTQSDAMNCCPLTSGSMVVTSRSRSGDDNNSVSPQADPLVLNPSSAGSAPPAYPLRLPNQSQIYLHVCVFLI